MDSDIVILIEVLVDFDIALCWEFLMCEQPIAKELHPPLFLSSCSGPECVNSPLPKSYTHAHLSEVKQLYIHYIYTYYVYFLFLQTYYALNRTYRQIQFICGNSIMSFSCRISGIFLSRTLSMTYLYMDCVSRCIFNFNNSAASAR